MLKKSLFPLLQTVLLGIPSYRNTCLLLFKANTPHDNRSPKLRSYYSKRHSHRGNNKSTSSSKDIAAAEPRSGSEGSVNQKKDLGPELVNVEDAELSDGCNVDIVGDGDDL